MGFGARGQQASAVKYSAKRHVNAICGSSSNGECIKEVFTGARITGKYFAGGHYISQLENRAGGNIAQTVSGMVAVVQLVNSSHN